MDMIVKRPVGRPKGTTVGINERLARYRLSELCAEFTAETIALWGRVLRGEPLEHVEQRGKKRVRVAEWPTLDDRLKAGCLLMDRAFGRPAAVAEIDQTTRDLEMKKVIEVKWLPPDPNDKSAHIMPEPD